MRFQVEAQSECQAVPCEVTRAESFCPTDACIHQLFEIQAARSPESTAVEFGNERLTYRELNARSNQLAHHLRGLGVGPDVTVGICLERSIAMVVGLLAILKAGGAYIPLDPSYPPARLQFMLQDAKARILLVQENLGKIFPEATQMRIYLDSNWWKAAPQNFENPESGSTPENLAYLIYTSGSTGTPKGVAMGHRALVNLIDWHCKTPHLRVAAKTLQFTSLSFDVSFQEIFSTWCTGATLVLIPAELRLAPSELWNFVVEQEIARIFLPFAALRQFADAAVQNGSNARYLREIITAGEQLQITPSLRELFCRHPEATLHNHYGPSETHVVTAQTLGPDPRQWPALPSIGRPIQNTRIHILDENHQPASLGTAGELFIGGIALARGYFERPAITAERFISDPFSPEPGARLYRTGDLAMQRADGNIDFLGRIDQQVKIRGNRVELGEIEAVLVSHPQVQGAVVIARDFRNGDKCLAAYVVWRTPSGPPESELRHFLKEKLPDYMVPSDVVALACFPLTPSGKVDRKAFPAPTPRIVSKGAEHLLPQSENERRIAEIFQQLLQCASVGLDDDFHQLGGDSLLAVELIMEINRAFSTHLDVLTMLQKPTVRALARLVDLEETGRVYSKLVRVRSGGDGAPIFFLNTSLKPYGPLSRIGGREPIFATEVPWLAKEIRSAVAGDLAGLPHLPQIAARHSELIIKQGFHGPCFLAGFSYGGALAFEVAHQLVAAGIPVQAVFLFDSNMEPYGWRRAKFWCQRQARKLREGGLDRFGFLLRVVRRRSRRNLQSNENPPVSFQLSTSAKYISGGKVPWPVLDRIWAHAVSRYRSRPLSSQGILFRAQNSIYEEKHDYDGKLGWRGLFEGGLDVVEVPGSHTAMWEEPHIRTLIHDWENSLERVRPAEQPEKVGSGPVDRGDLPQELVYPGAAACLPDKCSP